MKALLAIIALGAAVIFGWPLIDQDTTDECTAAGQKTAIRQGDAMGQLLLAQGLVPRAANLGKAMIGARGAEPLTPLKRQCLNARSPTGP
jgi:hypothetical protein